MTTRQDEAVYRINRFSVPASARSDFIDLLAHTHDVLRAQPGFIDETILELRSGSDEFNLVTIVKFEGEDALQPAISAIAAADAEAGIDRRALSREWGVEAQIAFYHPFSLHLQSSPLAA